MSFQLAFQACPFMFSLWMLFSVGGLSVFQEAVGDCIPVLLLGNKIDNEKEREVPRGLGEQLAKVKSRHFHLYGEGGTQGQSGMSQSILVGAISGSLLGRKQVGKMGVLASCEWSSSCTCGNFHRKLQTAKWSWLGMTRVWGISPNSLPQDSDL